MPSTRSCRRTLPIAALLAAFTAGVAAMAWGPLTPPAGAVAPTAKPLSEVEPRVAINAANTPGDADSLYRIAQPGSYYLTGNITGVSGKTGIEIAAGGVTIDLRGFDMVGSAGALNAIAISGNALRNLTVRNGSIRSWPGAGVDLYTSSNAANVHLQDLTILACGSGILVYDEALIENCAVSYCIGPGIGAGSACTVRNCTSALNLSYGISVANGDVVTDCVAGRNGGNGITAGNGATVARCSTFDNTLQGVQAGDGCTISGCSSYSNGGDGLRAGSDGTITACSCYQNTGDGIRVTSQCTVSGNTCSDNGYNVGGSAGVHGTGTRNTITGNNCVHCGYGMVVDGAANSIFANVCSGNLTNCSIATGNVCHVLQANITTAPILGSTGGTAVGASDPRSNLTY
jgi:parallel beta-helix repeat protein